MLVDLVFPALCVACGLVLTARPGGPPLCSACLPDLVRLPEPRPSPTIAAPFAYEGPIAAAITALKFGGQAALAGPLGRLLAASADLDGRWDRLVPIPLHPLRALRRGFDQAQLVAAALVRAWPGASPPAFTPRALRRTRATPPQTDLDRAGRLENLDRAFACRQPTAVRGARILLVDDVTTTGATLQAGRAALLAAGAAAVDALALARALP